MKQFRKSILTLGAAIALGGVAVAAAPATAAGTNPCAPAASPCTARRANPCAGRMTMLHPRHHHRHHTAMANPCAAKANPCAAKANPCAAKPNTCAPH